uniref:HMA domain-containing protein n=1 Tax=Kalanchoe fedtschenkoi TaxID=63787 RepID=A0A7N0ZXK3_KALFE
MYCNACERSLANAISKFKGVERFTTDMKRNRVVITGKIDPEKVMKTLKKKTGKRVELVPAAKQEPEKVVDEKQIMESPSGQDGEALMKELVLFGGSHWRGCDLMTMFSDENPNACSVM